MSVFHEIDVETNESYVPTDEEAAEMLEFFRDDHDQEVFEEWMSDLPDSDYVAMRVAIDTIRRVTKTAWKKLPIPVLAGWIDVN